MRLSTDVPFLHPGSVGSSIFPDAVAGGPKLPWTKGRKAANKMNGLILVLRLLHIISGAFWVGAVITMVVFIEPTAEALGGEGERFLAHLAIQRRLILVMYIAATITAVAGGLLYWIDSGGLQASWITTHFGLGFTVGALAGIAAFSIPVIFGISFRSTIRQLMDAEKVGSSPGDPAHPGPSISMLLARMRSWSLVQVGLLLIALAAMATARYLP